MDVEVLIFGHFHHPIIEEFEVLLLSSGSAIVLEEPTTGQDKGHLNKFLARMKMLNEAGKTIILISHDMGVVAEYASRTIMMKDGGILMDVGTREVFSRSDILEEESIEPHLLARVCNDVRRAWRDIPVLLTVGELERYVG
ncbi:MAG: energy-coupling factor transport system ATP-binding protein [Candidatus Methanocomedens sp.]|nr:MAG: energy-coupling factor transport system ATP-binding protein [ANME-2 cluster archaeon]